MKKQIDEIKNTNVHFTKENLEIWKALNGLISRLSSLEERIEKLEKLQNTVTIVKDSDFSWKPNMKSAILKTMQDVYQKLYGKIPEIKAIHAGLECGLLGGVYPNWDMISFGPTIRYPHSPDEKVLIATVDKFWKFLVETLKAVPVKA